MLGQTSQIFAEAELAYRRDRLMADFPATTAHRRPHWPTGLFNRPRHHGRRPRHVIPAPHHLTARI
jgi:nuclear transport factor 2 (NTF2) superfamily protein